MSSSHRARRSHAGPRHLGLRVRLRVVVRDAVANAVAGRCCVRLRLLVALPIRVALSNRGGSYRHDSPLTTGAPR